MSGPGAPGDVAPGGAPRPCRGLRVPPLLFALLVLVLAACTNAPVEVPPVPAPSPPPAVEPTQVVVGVDDLGAGFNPHLAADASPVTTALATLVLPSVFRPDASGNLVLDTTVATSAQVVSVNPFTVSYELNVQASWSSNSPIAAEDFVYLWQQMRSQPGTVDAAGYRRITDVRSRAGGKAVDVVFDQPYPQWQQLFSGLLPAHILKDAPGSWTGALANGLPASGGPFRVVSVDRARGEVVLARNDLYWATPATPDQIVLRRLDPGPLAEGMHAGNVDVAIPRSTPDVRAALARLDPPPATRNAPEPSVTQLMLRSDGGPLADTRVRQAIGAIVDREAIRQAVAPDALPADAFGLAPSEPGYASTAPEGPPARPDLATAERLLGEAGYTRRADGRWTVGITPLTVVVGAGAERTQDVEVARLVAQQLEAAGIVARVVAPPAAELFGQPTVTPAPPPTTTSATAPSAPPGVSTVPATPSATPGTTSGAEPSGTTAPGTTATPSTTTSTTPAPSGPVQVDIAVGPRAVGDGVGQRLASDYGCPSGAGVPETRSAPGSFCAQALQPLLDALDHAAIPDPAQVATVEHVLWAQLPALPLFQPVTLVAATAAGAAATGIGPGPFATGPLTGAQRWTPPRQ